MRRSTVRTAVTCTIFAAQAALFAGVAGADCPEDAVRWASSSRRLYVSGPVTCTLSDLDVVAPSTALELVDASEAIWILRVNLFLEDGATLLLHGSEAGGDVDELRLRSNDSSDTGSIIAIRADWGALDLESTRITSWDEEAGGPDTEPESHGRSFIHVRSRLGADGLPDESRMDIHDSDLGYLGYQASESYGLVWKVSGAGEGLYDAVNVYGDITDSRIHHNWFGVYTYGAFGGRWANNEIDHNDKYGLDPHDDSDSLVIEDNDVHDNGNHGIICSQRCDDLVIRRNRSWNNVGHGIMLHRGVTDSIVEDNDVFDNTDTGIAIFESYGNVIRANRVYRNLRGIRLSVGSDENLFEENEVHENSQYGLYFYKGSDVPTSGDGHNRGNVFRRNVIRDNAKAMKLGESHDNLFLENTFAGNAAGMSFRNAQTNVLEANVIPLTEVVEVQAPSIDSSTIITRHDRPIRVDTDYSGARIIFRDTSTWSHRVPGSTVGTYVTPTESLYTLGAAVADVRNVYVYAIYGKPASGKLKLVIASHTSWSARSVSGSPISVDFTVGKLAASTPYHVMRGGTRVTTVTTSSSGVLAFTTTVGTGEASYSVVRAD